VAGEAILVGDSEIDALAARRAGVGFIGLATGGTSREVLWGGGALAVIDGISELLQVLPGYINRLYREPESDMIKI
jgi:phosphoglycolate phosphatase-like HAD superfamily hydrolase